MPQNLAQARVINPILSEHARGYRAPGNVALSLFPLAPVAAYGGQVLEFGKEAFMLYNSARAPGSNIKRIEFGYAGADYAIVPRALEAKVPYERMRDASQVPGINLASRAVNTVLRSMALEHEYNAAQIARNTANYGSDNKVTLTGSNSFNVDDTDPAAVVATAMEAIADSIGVPGNTVVLSRSALKACKFNPKIIERCKYTGGFVTLDLLKELFEVDNIVVGGAVTATAPDSAFAKCWGDDVIVAYVAQGDGDGAGNAEEPSYGYSYQIEGMPSVEDPYQDKNARSWIYQVADDKKPVLSGMGAGYLIKGAGVAAS